MNPSFSHHFGEEGIESMELEARFRFLLLEEDPAKAKGMRYNAKEEVLAYVTAKGLS